MPFVTITTSMPLGAEQKKQLMQATRDAVMKDLSSPISSVRIMLHELPSGNYLCEAGSDVPAIVFSIDMIAGRSEQAKANVIRSLSIVGHETTGASEDEIRAVLCDFPKDSMGMARGVTAKAAGR